MVCAKEVAPPTWTVFVLRLFLVPHSMCVRTNTLLVRTHIELLVRTHLEWGTKSSVTRVKETRVSMNTHTHISVRSERM
jgi:hypothetical protein